MVSPDQAVQLLKDASRRLSAPVKLRIECFKVLKKTQQHNCLDSNLETIYTWDQHYYDRCSRADGF